MKKILAYVGEDSIVTEEQAKILTHIHVAFGHLTVDGKLLSRNHPLLSQVKQIREQNPDIRVILSIIPKEPDAFTVVSASGELRDVVTQE